MRKVMMDVPRRRPPNRRVNIEVGKPYRGRKGSWLTYRYGREAVYVVVACDPIVTPSSSITILTPAGIAVCAPLDLRPIDDPDMGVEQEGG